MGFKRWYWRSLNSLGRSFQKQKLHDSKVSIISWIKPIRKSKNLFAVILVFFFKNAAIDLGVYADAGTSEVFCVGLLAISLVWCWDSANDSGNCSGRERTGLFVAELVKEWLNMHLPSPEILIKEERCQVPTSQFPLHTRSGGCTQCSCIHPHTSTHA